MTTTTTTKTTTDGVAWPVNHFGVLATTFIGYANYSYCFIESKRNS